MSRKEKLTTNISFPDEENFMQINEKTPRATKQQKRVFFMDLVCFVFYLVILNILTIYTLAITCRLTNINIICKNHTIAY